MPRSLPTLALSALLATGCASTTPEPTGLPLQIHWVRNSAEYRAILQQTFRLAGEALAQQVAGREPGSWAVAVDADETLISNSEESRNQALSDDGRPFEERWDEWVEKRAAPALPGAREFLGRVRELGGRIAVVTNRRLEHCPQTAQNLDAQGLPYDVILCRGEDEEKEARWARVEAGEARSGLPPLEIVMWVGDNIQDFPGLGQELRFADPSALADFGERFFVLPNPLYGSWEENPPD
ncbi:MAG: HAD family acid phosphatase [Thermoanaerobaculia bacterium]|nr:HAD family acid phosphatase [Thermoanaerobaculia bacterium]